MKMTATWAAGFILSGLMIAPIYAGPNEGFGTREMESIQSVQPGTSIQTVPKMDTLSKRNKAMLAQTEAARARRVAVKSETAGIIMMKKEDGLSRRNKARLKQAEEARKRQEIILTGLSPPMPD